MSKYEILTGCFEGQIVEEGQILDVPFDDLDDDLRFRIREWAEEQVGIKYIDANGGCDFARKGGSDTPIRMDEIKEDYENSWESKEVSDDEPVTLKPVSEW